MGADLKNTAAPAKVKVPIAISGNFKKFTLTSHKPCCVCTDEKAKRDECMLFSTSNDAQKECADLVGQYKQCMAGYGFKI
ncbi:cox17 protein [Pyrenophora tritici-repentis]|nr:cox17 protein [Pyrenophora tritici-repentis]KAI2476936.1 cox17 protein [Pyrenophora tritici-repentis]